MGNQNNGSLARVKRNTGNQNGEVVFYTKFNPTAKSGSKNESSFNETSNNTTELTEAQLRGLPYIKSAKLIPSFEANSKNYFIVQMIVLGADKPIYFFYNLISKLQIERYFYLSQGSTVVIFMYSTIRRKLLNSHNKDAKYEKGLQLFMMILVHFLMPVLNIYPSVYIWYDYKTNDKLAYSPQVWVFLR